VVAFGSLRRVVSIKLDTSDQGGLMGFLKWVVWLVNQVLRRNSRLCGRQMESLELPSFF